MEVGAAREPMGTGRDSILPYNKDARQSADTGMSDPSIE